MANYTSNYTGEQIDGAVGKIVSNSATNGQVLTADGNGGAAWQNGGGSSSDAVKYTEQTLTATQKMQARCNLDLPYEKTTQQTVDYITWDGDTTGKEEVSIGDFNLYHIKSVSLDSSLFLSSAQVTIFYGDEEIIDATWYNNGSGLYYLDEVMCVYVPQAGSYTIDGTTLTFQNNGLYFLKVVTTYISKVNIPNSGMGGVQPVTTTHTLSGKWITDGYYSYDTTKDFNTENIWLNGHYSYNPASFDDPYETTEKDIYYVNFDVSEFKNYTLVLNNTYTVEINDSSNELEYKEYNGTKYFGDKHIRYPQLQPDDSVDFYLVVSQNNIIIYQWTDIREDDIYLTIKDVNYNNVIQIPSKYITSEGEGTVISGSYAHAEGYRCIASDEAAHAEGYKTIASASCSHAEGQLTQALSTMAHAEGSGTKAYQMAHAEGYGSIAQGYVSHAEGRDTQANHQYSHAEGYGTKTYADYQHVQGKFNYNRDEAADIVGWGDSDSSRKNISTLYTTGDLHLKGDVYIGANDNGSGGTMLLTYPVSFGTLTPSSDTPKAKQVWDAYNEKNYSFDYSKVSASTSGSSTTEINYLTIDNTEYKLPSGSSGSQILCGTMTWNDQYNFYDCSLLDSSIYSTFTNGGIVYIKYDDKCYYLTYANYDQETHEYSFSFVYSNASYISEFSGNDSGYSLSSGDLMPEIMFTPTEGKKLILVATGDGTSWQYDWETYT